MALIKCPSCGKEISSRVNECSFCGKVLIEAKPQEKVSVKATMQENVLTGIFASVAAFVAFFICRSFVPALVSPLGDYAATAAKQADEAGLLTIIMIMLVGMLFFCIMPILIKQKPAIGFVAVIIITAILCICCLCIYGGSVMGTISECMYNDMKDYTQFYGAAVPMLQGAICIFSYEKGMKKSLLAAVVMLVVYVVIFALCAYLLMNVLYCGFFGISIAQIIGAAAIFIFAIIRSEGLKKLIKR